MRTETKKLQKVVAIVGPTACGKTDWGLRLAQKYKGEIISADSRQVYKKMDIGTAKAPGEWRRNGLRSTYYVHDIPHHLMDFLDPGKQFTVAEFRDKAIKYSKLAHKNNRIPFIIGGTGLYMYAFTSNLQIPRVAPNKKLRKSLEEKTNKELMRWLESLDPKTAKAVDENNKRRIIRALEVCILSGTPFSEQQTKGDTIFNFLQIGIEVDREVLYKRIEKRVQEMFDMGLLKEVEALLKQKYAWELPSMSGIGYSQFKEYFEGKISLEEVKEKLKRDTRRYAKRQLTWFKRDKNIVWCKDYKEADELVKNFLKD